MQSIDPPYNTGAKDWKYNNDYVDSEDTYRHSKWLSFMRHRLNLAKELLKDTGFIVCAIDHNELFTLGVLMDKIFGEQNRIGIVSVVHKPEGRNQEKFFGTSNEFMLVYARDISQANFNKTVLDEELQERFDQEDNLGRFRLKNFIRLTDGKYSLRENKPHFFYSIYVSKDLNKFSITKKDGFTEVTPTTDKGIERTWKTTKETFIKLANKGDIVAKQENGRLVLYEKLREDQVIKTHWIKKEYHAYHFGTKLLEEILGSKQFDFPKSLHLIIDIIKLIAKEDALILDFFAGSGTTGHAVLEMNKIDGGNRKFILCTNNENNNGGNGGIAESVCYPRIKAVIDGYKYSGEETEELYKQKITWSSIKNTRSTLEKITEIETDRKKDFDKIKKEVIDSFLVVTGVKKVKTRKQGIPSNLFYYKTDLVDIEQISRVPDDKKIAITYEAGEMIAVREDTLNVTEKNEWWQIFEGNGRTTAIYFKENKAKLAELIVKLEKKNLPVTLYIFSWGKNEYKNEYSSENIRVEDIPEPIIEVYRELNRI